MQSYIHFLSVFTHSYVRELYAPCFHVRRERHSYSLREETIFSLSLPTPMDVLLISGLRLLSVMPLQTPSNMRFAGHNLSFLSSVTSRSGVARSQECGCSARQQLPDGFARQKVCQSHSYQQSVRVPLVTRVCQRLVSSGQNNGEHRSPHLPFWGRGPSNPGLFACPLLSSESQVFIVVPFPIFIVHPMLAALSQNQMPPSLFGKEFFISKISSVETEFFPK